ncbi:hypothetical protein BC351_30145 [Paenibacillus ferrarius]|uniref:MORN motif-containing protein n=1 Tax=Paenibacillus ferrarius TaxID=1469647 RepID=A0A1V4HGX0_9BACL|nr:hypothetical protein [Paenibacillus ferrarius]OPH54984.1 hypothetical protein BC351_30145 [Paenibacillus ferrarius]
MRNVLAIMLLGSLLAISGTLGYKLYEKITDKPAYVKSEPSSSTPPGQNASTVLVNEPVPGSTSKAGENGAATASIPAATSSVPAKADKPGAAVKETTIKMSDITYKYIGEVVNGVAHGQGAAYYPNGQKRYEGEFVNGKINLVGKTFFKDGKLRSEGKRVNGVIQDIGYNEDGSLYSEMTRPENNKLGDAKIYAPEGYLQYAGQVTPDSVVPEGTGIEYHANGKTRYTGTFKNGAYNGTGTFISDDERDKYVGQFTSGVMSGKGKFYEYGTLYYDGEHQDGIYEGKGKFYMNGAIAYDGDFVNGNANGTGKMYDNGKLVYDGEVVENIPTGNGTSYLGGTDLKISITIRNPGVQRSSGVSSFNMPQGVRIPTKGDILK